MNGMRLGTYSVLSTVLVNNEPTSPQWTFIKLLFCGALAGIVGACAASPLFLVKTRMQIQSNAAKIGTQYQYSNTFDALKSIYKTDGFQGMYRGVSAAALRVAMGSSVQLSTYDTAKVKWQNVLAAQEYGDDSVAIHFLAAATSSLLATFVMNPFDVVSTRMYMQKTGEQKYNGILDCMNKTIRIEGIRGIYKGAVSQYCRLAPHTILTFIFWEQLKKRF
jgi:solute carrier family 25 protein 34/35